MNGYPGVDHAAPWTVGIKIASGQIRVGGIKFHSDDLGMRPTIGKVNSGITDVCAQINNSANVRQGHGRPVICRAESIP
jgi:hypothetical protein